MKTDFKNQAEIDLQRLLDKLIADYKPEKVILFGSYAYGNPTRDSDLDLFIIKETSSTPFKRRVEVRRICYDLQRRTAFQPLVATPEEWRQRIEMGDPFFIEVAKKGKILYEARFDMFREACSFVEEYYTQERYPFLPSPIPARDEFDEARHKIEEMIAYILQSPEPPSESSKPADPQ